MWNRGREPDREWPREVGPLRPLLMAHLERLEWWSIFCALGGLALPLVWQRGEVLVFGLMTSGWAVVNILIAVLGKRGKPPKSLRGFAGVLVLNQMANYLYVLVGSGVAVFGQTPEVRAGALAVVLQGFALLLLDGYLIKQVRDVMRGAAGR